MTLERLKDMTCDERVNWVLDRIPRFAELGEQGRIDVLCAIDNAIRAAVAEERESCAKVAAEWAKGAAAVNDAEGRPFDPRQDIETAGDQIADAIRNRV